MTRYSQGLYVPKNPEKYIGKNKPKYRSSWELRVMQYFDTSKGVLGWASESIAVPYRNPLTGKIASYYPDFFVQYMNKNGKQIAEVIEVKPRSQSSLMEAKSKNDQLHAVVNMAKWTAAKLWCKQQGFNFRVITEVDIFVNGKNK
jgi:hypothetical protein